jgi:hypothetical protein
MESMDKCKVLVLPSIEEKNYITCLDNTYIVEHNLFTAMIWKIGPLSKKMF